jgi:hypothetical protein
VADEPAAVDGRWMSFHSGFRPMEGDFADALLLSGGRRRHEPRQRCVLMVGQVSNSRIEGEPSRDVRVDELRFEALLARPRTHLRARSRGGVAALVEARRRVRLGEERRT